MLKQLRQRLAKRLNRLNETDYMVLEHLRRLDVGFPVTTPLMIRSDTWLALHTIYLSLDKLQRQSLVERREGEIPVPERGNRPRVFYGITERGCKVLEEHNHEHQ